MYDWCGCQLCFCTGSFLTISLIWNLVLFQDAVLLFGVPILSVECLHNRLQSTQSGIVLQKNVLIQATVDVISAFLQVAF